VKDIIINDKEKSFYSKRDGKRTTVPIGFASDGATGVSELEDCFWFHDWGYFFGKWDDGSRMSKEEADWLYKDVLKSRGYSKRSFIRRWGVKLFAGKAWKAHRQREINFINSKFRLT